jgi:hypothetical protein
MDIKTTCLSLIGISNFGIPIKGICTEVDGAENLSAIFWAFANATSAKNHSTVDLIASFPLMKHEFIWKRTSKDSD